MSVRIKKGVDPVGTKHVLHHFSDGAVRKTLYRVMCVKGGQTHIPGDEPEVYCEAAQKTGHPHQVFFNLPLSVFADKFSESEPESIFWESSKVDRA